MAEIKRGISFYEKLFKESTKLEWREVVKTAADFQTFIKNDWPAYDEEIRGKRRSSPLCPHWDVTAFVLPLVAILWPVSSPRDMCDSNPRLVRPFRC